MKKANLVLMTSIFSTLFLPVISFAVAATASPSPVAPTYTVEPNASQIHFLAVGKPALIKIKGEGAKPEAQLKIEGENLTGQVVIDLNQFTTGIETRDHHMKEKYLECTQQPYAKAVLQISKADVGCLPVKNDDTKTCQFEGRLELHGKSKAINGPVTIKKIATGFEIHSGFNLVLSEYGINIPSFAGVTVADNVEVTADLQMKPVH